MISSDQLHRLQGALGRRYRVIDLLGAGGMGSVYSAEDTRHARRVAVKVLDDSIAEAVGASRFLREIGIAARLQHPHILPLFDSGESDGVLFYVMPLVAGESLRQRIDRDEQLPLAVVCRITRQIAAGLAYAHTQGIVHRDIKPANVLLSHGEAVLADFGIATARAGDSESNLTVAGVVLGTPTYMSPEQATGEARIDGRSDQYSLACVVYEMLTGYPPFSGSTAQALIRSHVCDAPPVMSHRRHGVPAAMEAAVRTALSKDPASRYRTVLDFAAALEAGSMDSSTAGAHARDAATQRPVNAGRLVSKTCDRWTQVNAFDAHLRTSWKTYPRRPIVFVIPGSEGEGHDSLLERLWATTIARFAEEVEGPEHASVLRIHAPWPDAPSLAVAQRDLAISLFREADPRHMDDDLTSAALRRCVADRLAGVAIVHHDVRARAWRRDTPQLIEWYVNQFWGAIEARRGDPQFLIFLKIIYPEKSSAGFLHSVWPVATQRQRIGRTLQRFSFDPARCGWMVFNELQSITVDDVKDWFSKNYIFESELQREASARSVFNGATRKRMVDVEPALAKIHDAAMSAQPLSW